MGKKTWQVPAHLDKLFMLLFLLLFSFAAFSQMVIGTVTDPDKKAINNAPVQIKGANRTALPDNMAACSLYPGTSLSSNLGPGGNDTKLNRRFARMMSYPKVEASANTTNYQAAATVIGGDKLILKVFGDNP